MNSANPNENVRETLAWRKSPHKGRSHIRNRPFVVATFAMTADGKVTTKNFGPVDFTSREDKLHLFRQRALADAVLLGTQVWNAIMCGLDCRQNCRNYESSAVNLALRFA